MEKGQRPVGPLAENEYLCTFRYFDSKGRRLTICARQEGATLKVVVLTLSDEPEPATGQLDVFNRKKGREIYEANCQGKEGEETCKGLRFDVPIQDGDPRLSFFLWCKGRYYKWTENVVNIPFRQVILAKANGKTRLHSSKRVRVKVEEKSESKSEEAAQ